MKKITLLFFCCFVVVIGAMVGCASNNPTAPKGQSATSTPTFTPTVTSTPTITSTATATSTPTVSVYCAVTLIDNVGPATITFSVTCSTSCSCAFTEIGVIPNGGGYWVSPSHDVPLNHGCTVNLDWQYYINYPTCSTVLHEVIYKNGISTGTGIDNTCKNALESAGNYEPI